MSTVEERWGTQLRDLVQRYVHQGQTLEQAVDLAKSYLARMLMLDQHLDAGSRKKLASFLVVRAEELLVSGLPTSVPPTLSVSVVDSATFTGEDDKLKQRQARKREARTFNPRKQRGASKGKVQNEVD